jgi:trk system potassium uptake protein
MTMISRIINFRVVFKVLSKVLFILSSATLGCSLIAIIYSEDIKPFIFTSLVAFVTGIGFRALTNQNHDDSVNRKDAYLTVTLTWFIISIIGSMPYLFSGTIPSYTDAFFESVSGFTTTGSSILIDIESLPRSILFWRSLTHWIGGIGFIVLVIVIMPTLRIGGYHLFTLESSLREKIQPRVKEVGIRLLMIYIALTVLEVLFLLAGKMDLYESVCHAFGTIATGGFSPKNTSIAGYSPYIQYVVMVFMVLSGTNFVIHFYLLKKQFRKIKQNEEFRFYLLVIFFAGMIASFTLFFQINKSAEESFREGFFQVISIVTCTGYATADYLEWPVFAWTLLFIAMFLGGSTGSTSGGIKMARHLIVFKNLRNTFLKLSSSNLILTIRLNKKSISENINNAVLTFITIYFMVFIAGCLLMVMTGIDSSTAAGSVATAMAGIGPGIGTVGPASNFAHLPDTAKLLLSFLMLTGRLEIYTVLILFSRNFWR